MVFNIFTIQSVAADDVAWFGGGVPCHQLRNCFTACTANTTYE